MTSSAGKSGLTRVGSPPMRLMASRMAARSTTAGTPVKSCRITRAGMKAISVVGHRLRLPAAAAPRCAPRSTTRPSSSRSRFSSRMRSENGSRLDVVPGALERAKAVKGEARDRPPCRRASGCRSCCSMADIYHKRPRPIGSRLRASALRRTLTGADLGRGRAPVQAQLPAAWTERVTAPAAPIRAAAVPRAQGSSAGRKRDTGRQPHGGIAQLGRAPWLARKGPVGRRRRDRTARPRPRQVVALADQHLLDPHPALQAEVLGPPPAPRASPRGAGPAGPGCAAARRPAGPGAGGTVGSAVQADAKGSGAITSCTSSMLGATVSKMRSRQWTQGAPEAGECSRSPVAPAGAAQRWWRRGRRCWRRQRLRRLRSAASALPMTSRASSSGASSSGSSRSGLPPARRPGRAAAYSSSLRYRVLRSSPSRWAARVLLPPSASSTRWMYSRSSSSSVSPWASARGEPVLVLALAHGGRQVLGRRRSRPRPAPPPARRRSPARARCPARRRPAGSSWRSP